VRRYNPKACALALVLCLVLVGVSNAQSGWAVSEVIMAPRTEFSVTGPYPYACLSEEEEALLRRDPVHRFQVWASRWLEDTTGRVSRLQRHASCATACATVPRDAHTITDIHAYVTDGPDTPYHALPPGIPGAWIIWDDTVMTSQTSSAERLVCLQLKNWVHSIDRYGYFIVYYER
jgi:hypothetical protein